MKHSVLLLTLVLSLLSITGLIRAQNSMELILSIQGAHENAGIGYYKAAIDFNGDGYDDLIMYQNRNFDTHEPGKLLCYFGGPEFDGIPDLECQGEFWDQGPGLSLLSGDFNGDGYGDLVERVFIAEDPLQMGLRFYFGGPGADLEPDLIIPLASLGDPLAPSLCELIIEENIGDINNDGCDDIIALHITPDSPRVWSVVVLFGGTYHTETVLENFIEGSVINVSAVGDVNGDGIDDFVIGYKPLFNPNDFSLTLYYGNDGYFDPSDKVVLYDDSTEPYNNYPFAFGIGDFNGDGYDDYLSFWVDTPAIDYGFKIKLGSSTLPESPELNIDMTPWTELIGVWYQEVSFGDFNGDGYSDMITSDHESGFWKGAAGLWLGGPNPNGVLDLRITPPNPYSNYQFGWGRPTVGDFNGDGYDDVAFCAPQSSHGTTNYRGWVYIYAGNAQLTDTTVANDENVIQATLPRLNIFPNPADKNLHQWNYYLEGDLPSGVKNSRIDIYNIRGQLITSFPIANPESKQGTFGKLTLAPGLYIASFVSGEQKVAATKFIIK
ncbi:MAG: T9SS type A sorting domain-containing protein [Candidatus Cloacimonetes bacterium]|nr:T9SS type A sorting domain-containing protein [Candidatus Cloacimonadota bacterium]